MKNKISKYLFLAILLLAVMLSGDAQAAIAHTEDASLVAWPQITVYPLPGQYDHPVHITNAGDGSLRMYIVEQPGVIRIMKNGILLPVPFLDIHGQVRYSGGEEGLLSVAFPPNYADKAYFFVYYTTTDGNNRVSRFNRMAGNPDQADPASEQVVIIFNHPTYENHNGGQTAFGADGYLYIGTGDGGGGGDPNGNAQNPASLLGKILRIDVDSNLSAYTIPASNPYTQTAGYRGEIWSLGLRNPWRFAFDRLTHDLYIGDVGQNDVEEVDFQPASSVGGENYGWKILEGSACYSPSSGCVPPAFYNPPAAEYTHGVNDSNGCAVTGGGVYRGNTFPRMQGFYFYADFCTGKIWGLINQGGWQSNLLLDTSLKIASFGEDELGNLYLSDLASGRIFWITDFENPSAHRIYIPAFAGP